MIVNIKAENKKKKKYTDTNTNTNTNSATVQQQSKKNLPVQMKLTNLKATNDSFVEKKSSIKNIKSSRKQSIIILENNILNDIQKYKNKPDKMISSIEHNVLNDFYLLFKINK